MNAAELCRGAGRNFLFHYTDAVKADLIIEDRLFVAGPRAAHGYGVYATDIAPVDGQTIDDVIVNCFRGDATPPEVDHAIVLRIASGERRFEPTTDPYQWVLSTGRLELVHLEDFYVAAMRFDGRAWTVIDED